MMKNRLTLVTVIAFFFFLQSVLFGAGALVLFQEGVFLKVIVLSILAIMFNTMGFKLLGLRKIAFG